MREQLPQRRKCETLSFRIGNHTFQGSVGYYDDGRPGEIFLDCSKSGTDVQIAARDSAIAVSMALQHGASIESIRTAFTRKANGSPEVRSAYFWICCAGQNSSAQSSWEGESDVGAS